ncbi:hypothetical protein PUN4_430156 [Paraburkholderia unamae]|nr:hypothetical protein PUN4_430156 [Paraburkholderia unamae]
MSVSTLTPHAPPNARARQRFRFRFRRTLLSFAVRAVTRHGERRCLRPGCKRNRHALPPCR